MFKQRESTMYIARISCCAQLLVLLPISVQQYCFTVVTKSFSCEGGRMQLLVCQAQSNVTARRVCAHAIMSPWNHVVTKSGMHESLFSRKVPQRTCTFMRRIGFSPYSQRHSKFEYSILVEVYSSAMPLPLACLTNHEKTRHRSWCEYRWHVSAQGVARVLTLRREAGMNQFGRGSACEPSWPTCGGGSTIPRN